MSKVSEKKVSINEVPYNQGNYDKELNPSQESPSKDRLQKSDLLGAFVPILILMIVSFAVYFNALSGDFIHDDILQIKENQWITDFSNIPAIFSENVWSFKSMTSNYYRPLMHVVYTINYHLFGLNPWGFHLVNILLHWGASLLVFLVIGTLLPQPEKSATPLYFSPPFIAALLFATHPIHTEAVTWIAGLPDVAFTFFYLLSFYFYAGATTVQSWRYLLSLLSFAAASFFKEPALTLPAILFAYDTVMREKRFHLPDYVKRYAPYVAVAMVYMAMRIHALGQFAPSQKRHELSTYEYIINVFPLFIEYLGKLILPLNLNAFYVFHPIHSIFQLKGLLSLLATSVFVGIMFIALKKSKPAFVGLIVLTAPLLPVLYIPGLGVNTFAERYLYLPSVGYSIILAVFLSWAELKQTRAVRSISMAFLVMVCLYAAGAITRNNVWHDNFVFWFDTVKKSPDSAIAHNNLGNQYTNQGQVDSGLVEFETAVRLDPKYIDAYNNLGVAYALRGFSDKAIDAYQTALRMDPDFVEAHYNIGLEYASQGQWVKALYEYRIAIFLNPDYAEAHFSLGQAYASQGQFDRATAEYESALRIKPDYAEARQHLNDILSKRR